MEEETHLNFVITLLFTLLFMVLYFINLVIVIKYIIDNFNKKKLSIYWIQYTITCLTNVLLVFIYLCYLMKYKEEKFVLFDENKNPALLILLTIFLVASVYIVINNLIYDILSSLILSFNFFKLMKLTALNFEEFYLKIKYIETNLFNSKQNILYWIIFGIIDIFLIIVFELEYMNYDDKETSSILKLDTFITYLLKSIHIFFLTILIVCFTIMNYLRKKFFLKNYYNKDEKLAMKIYNIKSCQIIYNSDIISYKIIADLIINGPILYFLISKICNIFFLILSEFFLFSYILILGALYLRIDKNNEIGKISSTVKYWFCLKDIHFHLSPNDHDIYINENTYKYTKKEKEILKNLNLGDIEEIFVLDKINDETRSFSRNEDSKLDINEVSITSNDKLSFRRKSKSKLKTNNILNFDINSELYVLFKLLMLYFEKNEGIYLDVQNKINQDGSPFNRFFVEKNITKNKKVRSRQTFGGNDAIGLKNNFINNIDRISRISKINSKSIITSMKFRENKIFFSLEEKELKEEFKKKYDGENETTFNIESLAHDSFFELFPFYQISIQDIKKSLNPSDNKKIYDVLRTKHNIKKENKEKKIVVNESKKNNNEAEENNLFYTYNSLLMIEVYDPEDFILFNELYNFSLSYGTYLLDNIKNINFTFIPLILGVFNVEICGINKVVILYRNPLYFSNFNHFNHWINFYITEGPEKLKVSVLQKDVIDINQIEIKNSLKMNESDYEEILNNLKRDFSFFTKMNIQVYPIIHLFIGDENSSGGGGNNNDANESSLMSDISQQNDLSGLLNNLEDTGNIANTNINNKFKIDEDDFYLTERNSLVDKEYYSLTGLDVHTIKIYFTHLFRLDCELNKQNDKNDNSILKSNHYCQYLEGQVQTYLNKTTLFELDGNEN